MIPALLPQKLSFAELFSLLVILTSIGCVDMNSGKMKAAKFAAHPTDQTTTNSPRQSDPSPSTAPTSATESPNSHVVTANTTLPLTGSGAAAAKPQQLSAFALSAAQIRALELKDMG